MEIVRTAHDDEAAGKVPIHLGTAIDWKCRWATTLDGGSEVPIHLGTAIDWKFLDRNLGLALPHVPIHLGTAIDWKYLSGQRYVVRSSISSYSLRDGDRLEI